MSVQITRIDPMAGIPDSHEPGVLSMETFDNWEAAFDSLRARGIPLTEGHEEEFRSHPDTQFQWNEFINAGTCAHMCHVNYDVREV